MVKGMMDHGKKSWKKIWDEQPGLQNIKQAALKDRARSNRFKAILERAELNPSLIHCPDELCGPPDQHVYSEDQPTPQPESYSEELVAEDMLSLRILRMES